MGRIAATEDVEGIREEYEVKDPLTETKENDDTTGEQPAASPPPSPTTDSKGKYIATVIEVQDAFDSLNTLRYSQPTHLQGMFLHS
jgi:cleavage and polyadenylation specificity factor subunit 2